MAVRTTGTGGTRENWPDRTFVSGLTERSRHDLLALARPHRVPAGRVLISQGERGGRVFLLRSGPTGATACVKVTATASNGAETLLGIRVGGDIVGELAALRDAGRSATVTTCTDAVVHRIPGRVFVDFLRSHSEAWEVLCRMLADRLEWANRRQLDFGGYPVTNRLARVLLELVQRHGRMVRGGHHLGVALSQAELGALIGARPDAIGLAMRDLRAAGLVISGYRSLVLTDLVGLQRYIDAD
ncbi:Crp/Fnr family transcriptional regulator [Nocardia sp. NBC_00416]|uniref:Crp/Fnr family transcriptional regulator n=1 Tax=Nocardia sp. NBC_00416 TaxID=2975991 RepID=UPI002E22AC41